MADPSRDLNHVHSPEGGMDPRLHMATNRRSDSDEQFSDGVIHRTSVSTQVQSRNLQLGQRVGPGTFGIHRTGAEDHIDHSMGWPLYSVQLQHPARPTGRFFIEASPPTGGVDRETRCDPQPVKLSNDSQCILDIGKSDDCRDSLWCIGCGQDQRETGDQPKKTGTSSPPSSQGPEREYNSNTRILGFRQLCRNDPMGSTDKVEARTPHQHTDDQCREQSSDTALSKLQEMVDQYLERLKEDRFGFHEATNEIVFSERELKVFAEVMDMASIRPMFVDHSGFVIWVVDGKGRMFAWNRMERSLQLMGDNLIEGLKKYFEDPENMLVWEDGDWVPKKELERLGDEMYERMVAKGPRVIPGEFTKWGKKKKQKKQKHK